MDELISIIVPVYKVEQYLIKCVSSLQAQTHSNIEIILVDDGSPDKCGEICDRLKEADSRIRVIHKQNGGLSDARNAGLDVAQGEYVGFVDSDDWVEPEMYEKMLSSLQENQADIAICCIEKVFKDKSQIQDVRRDHVYTNRKALYELINDKSVNNFAWNKLYKKDLFLGLRYPVGRIFEDLLFTYKLFERANRVTHLNSVYYHYLRRDDSILSTWPLNIEIEFLVAQQDRYRDMIEKHPIFSKKLSQKYISSLYNLKRVILNKGDKSERRSAYLRIKNELLPFFKQYSSNLIKENNLSSIQTISLFFFLNFPAMHGILYPILKKR